MDDGKGMNRRASSGRKTVVDRDSLRDVIRSSVDTIEVCLLLAKQVYSIQMQYAIGVIE